VTREETIDFLIEEARSQKHRGHLENADVTVPGGNPGCGDVVTVHLKVNRDADRVEALRFEGEGCTISQAAASVLAGMVQGAPLSQIEGMDYNDMVDALGREVVQSRPRCATLALSTLKSAVREYRAARLRDQARAVNDRGDGAGAPEARAGTGTGEIRKAPATPSG
jgi:nitrogen fixation protein NifU and related proteins